MARRGTILARGALLAEPEAAGDRPSRTRLPFARFPCRVREVCFGPLVELATADDGLKDVAVNVTVTKKCAGRIKAAGGGGCCCSVGEADEAELSLALHLLTDAARTAPSHPCSAQAQEQRVAGAGVRRHAPHPVPQHQGHVRPTGVSPSHPVPPPPLAESPARPRPRFDAEPHSRPPAARAPRPRQEEVRCGTHELKIILPPDAPAYEPEIHIVHIDGARAHSLSKIHTTPPPLQHLARRRGPLVGEAGPGAASRSQGKGSTSRPSRGCFLRT